MNLQALKRIKETNGVLHLTPISISIEEVKREANDKIIIFELN